MSAFIKLPCGRDGRDEVTINVEEIAAYRSHTVVSYSYQEWVEVTLKNGQLFDCCITKADFEKRFNAALGHVP